ncbi:MAG: zinc-ribbon domain-containing protein [Clostridium lundense]|nr:zinc-ribbon domain-containing protein [Clostridium lundense]
MFCTNCGSENKETAKFCTKCGTALRTGNAEILNKVSEEDFHNVVQANTNQASRPPKGNEVDNINSKNSMNKTTIAVVFFVLALATVIFFIYTGGKKDFSNEENKSVVQDKNPVQNKSIKQAKINISEINTDSFPVIKLYFSVLDENNNVISGLNLNNFKIGEKIGKNVEIIDQTISELKLSDENESLQYMLSYTSKNPEASNALRNLVIDLNNDNYISKVNAQFETQSVSDKLVIENIEKDIRSLLVSQKGDYSVAYQDLRSDNTMYINSKKTKAASIIKLYIMADVFNQIKDGRLSGNDEITLVNSMKAGGSGILSGQKEGTRLSIYRLTELMIADSDNTAANMLIDRLGMNNINDTINRLGCTDTILQRKMMDTESANRGIENYTSVKDLNLVLSKMYKNQCVDPTYDKKMIEILKQQKNNGKIPDGIPKHIQVAHKTGELVGVENDAGIVFTPNGDYILSILNDGTDNGTAVKNDIQISKIVYENRNKFDK